ncbi:MAG TPA: 6-phosphofructokinase [Clostridiales bacterium]|nr:6-phosphofructokinase [Clostridiales bacterium]HQP70694.1 6-phosphofructokinase [Clostridiales bacterium]
MKKGSVAILCGGGPAPGINTVVATIAKRFLSDGYKVLGLNYGYKTLFKEKPDFIELNFDIADRIFCQGGSYLKMSRYKPKDDEFSTDFVKEHDVKLLVTIGGDDTASSANRLTKYLEKHDIKIQNIHVPKTIDNDLPLPYNLPTFGYHTSKNEGTKIALTVYEDGRTSGNWFIVCSMGREAGHLAFGIGASAQYPMIIVPEMFKNVEVTYDRMIRMMVSSIVKRMLLGIDYGGIIISEGVYHFMSDEEILKSDVHFSYDEHGHPELGKVSKAHIFNSLLQVELNKLRINVKSRPVEIGYEVRCVDPIAFDLKYCSSLGNGVKELFDRGEKGCIVIARPDGRVEPLYLKDIADEKGKIKPRLLDTESESFKLTFNSMDSIKEEDYDDAKKYLSDPEEYNLKNILGL